MELWAPAVTAKECASLDRLSGGRLLLGIGVGWLEEEFDALGVPFAGRGARTDAYVAAMRALWTGEEVDLDDGYQTWKRAISLAAATGPTAGWSRGLGDLDSPARDFGIDLGELEDAEFRCRIAAALDATRHAAAILRSARCSGECSNQLTTSDR